jgi:hypothetical protein
MGSTPSSRPGGHGAVMGTFESSARHCPFLRGRRRRAKYWSGSGQMSAEAWYLDSSALVKTVIEEPESPALMRWLDAKSELVACGLVRVEVVRAVRVADPSAVPRARQAIETLTLIRLDDALYDAAAGLHLASLRSLDAVHLAAALSLGGDLAGVVTYDTRMAEAARGLDLHVEAPGRPGCARR